MLLHSVQEPSAGVIEDGRKHDLPVFQDALKRIFQQIRVFREYSHLGTVGQRACEQLRAADKRLVLRFALNLDIVDCKGSTNYQHEKDADEDNFNSKTAPECVKEIQSHLCHT